MYALDNSKFRGNYGHSTLFYFSVSSFSFCVRDTHTTTTTTKTKTKSVCKSPSIQLRCFSHIDRFFPFSRYIFVFFLLSSSFFTLCWRMSLLLFISIFIIRILICLMSHRFVVCVSQFDSRGQPAASALCICNHLHARPSRDRSE